MSSRSFRPFLTATLAILLPSPACAELYIYLVVLRQFGNRFEFYETDLGNVEY